MKEKGKEGPDKSGVREQAGTKKVVLFFLMLLENN